QEENGALQGKIVKLLPQQGMQPNPTCTQCEGGLKDKPLMGMTVLWDVNQKDGGWNAKLLTPKTGKVYDANLKLIDGGSRLQINVKAGLVSRTLSWHRINPRETRQ